MKICGLQKTTLIDYPGRIACTIFLYGCNFRCPFCYNADLVTKKAQGIFSEENILKFLKDRQNTLDGVCITGGEPLLTIKKDFLKKIKEMGYAIKIDTNGTNPQKLSELIQENLIDAVAMDIKGAKEDYDLITGSQVSIGKIEESIKIVSKLDNYEFRTTILKEFHSPEKIQSISEWLTSLTESNPKKYFLQGFKGKGDFINKKYEKYQETTENYLIRLKELIEKDFEEVKIRW
jgi:pyruvate formate lyase activating enzyme